MLVVSGSGREGSIAINQDAEIFVGKFLANKEMFFAVKKDRKIWIQIISGNLLVNDLELESGDAVAILEEDLINIRAKKNSEFLLFDL